VRPTGRPCSFAEHAAVVAVVAVVAVHLIRPRTPRLDALAQVVVAFFIPEDTIKAQLPEGATMSDPTGAAYRESNVRCAANARCAATFSSPA